MKTNLIEGDFDICKLLDGYWLQPAKVAKKLMRSEEDVSARMTKLTKRGLLDRQDGVYRLSLARRLAIKKRVWCGRMAIGGRLSAKRRNKWRKSKRSAS